MFFVPAVCEAACLTVNNLQYKAVDTDQVNATPSNTAHVFISA